MAYTSRSDALEFKCPFCGVEATEKCVGARGKKRESVHRERMRVAARELNHASIRTLAVEGDRVLAEDGTVVGRVVSLELDIQADRWEDVVGNLRRGEERGDVPTPSEAKEEPSPGGAGGSPTGVQQALLEDPVDEVWDFYRQTLDRPKAQLTPKVRRWIADAIKAVGMDECKQAIAGLAASEYHRQNGYVGIEYAIVPKQGQTIESRVAMMASKAGERRAPDQPTTVAALLVTVPSDRHVVVHGHVDRVLAMLRSDREHTQRAGRESLAWLREHPPYIEPVFEDKRLRGWRKVR